MTPPTHRRLQRGGNPGGQAIPAAEAKSAKSIGRRKRARHSSSSPDPPLDSPIGKRKKKVLTPSPKACTPIAKKHSKMADVVTPNTENTMKHLRSSNCTKMNVHQNECANLLVEKLKGQLKDVVDALLKAEGSGDAVDAMKDVEECTQVRMDIVKTMQSKRSTVLLSTPSSKVPPVEAKHFTEVEFFGGNKCEEHNSKVLVHDEKEDVLDKDAATSNIDNLDHIISMIAKSTIKDPLDVDTSFRVEGQVPCASNIEDQEDKNRVVMQVGAGGASEDKNIIIERSESTQEDGDASVDVGGEASCADGAINASENYKPPQGDGDASVDASGDGICAAGAGGVEYVRHDDGTVSWQRKDGGGAGGVAGYVRNDDGMLSRPWEDPGNILFESKPALILDINGVLLTLVDKRYSSQMPAYWNDLEIVDRAGVFVGYKRDAPAFLDWCLVHFDVFVWTYCMKNKVEKMLRACFPNQFCRFKEILTQHDCVRDARFKINGGKLVFYKKLSDLWEK
ncbi:hypothetical protein L7F22_017182 [Adiantum nelumboides]|nr:hypothetical protein [Adiantum nelumboides]